VTLPLRLLPPLLLLALALLAGAAVHD